jgi:hypothetical protein
LWAKQLQNAWNSPSADASSTVTKADLSMRDISIRSSLTSTSSSAAFSVTSPYASSTPFDHLDVLSERERIGLQDYHSILEEEVAAPVAGGGPSHIPAPPSAATHLSSTPIQQRGRPGLLRQHSWSGRESTRNIHMARGSIFAEVDDCSFQELLSVIQKEDNDLEQHHGQNNHVQYDGYHHCDDPFHGSYGEGENVISLGRTTTPRSKQERCVMDLVT